ncbi:MAG TPA: hypothetical protein VMS22_07115 [Candidatus Eisenbacteria bacterium]|nr:hypothetical protein [Candidatus Eisenbacteria bacterium]
MQDSPVKVGHMLLTMVDPHRGHEVAYNRWYERDHFYAGCLVGPWLFAGRRWVAPRALKALRYPRESALAKPDVTAGSYVAIYWIHADRFDEHREWAGQQVRWLYQNGRGFAARTHVHTLLYNLEWTLYRDADPVPIELALDHGFAGMAMLAVRRAPGVSAAAVDAWWRAALPPAIAGTPIATCASWSAVPQRGAPMDIPVVDEPERLRMHLFFLDTDPLRTWHRFETLGRELAASKLGEVVFASPWLPTIVGTDTYTDELW